MPPTCCGLCTTSPIVRMVTRVLRSRRYRDVRYVEELVGRDTVTTMTPKTIDAFRDHGQPCARLEEGLDDAHRVVEALDRIGISLSDITEKLLTDGITLFCTAFDNVLAATQRMIDRPCDGAHSKS
jgi:transaldolase